MSAEKLRQYIRYEINLIATLAIDKSSSIQCSIRDFCSKGLFLELQQFDNNALLTPHQKIQICFTASHENGNEDFCLDVEIMNIRTNGLGVAFKSNSDLIFEALKKESKNTFKVTSAGKRNNPANLSRQKNLEADLLSLLREVLPAIIQRFQQHTQSELTKIDNQDKDIMFSTALAETITNLSLNQDVILEGFRHVTEETGYVTHPVTSQTLENNTEASLSLIDKKEFEDWLDLSTIIRSLESLYERQLDQLQKKIAFIVDVDKNRVINPASPERLCNKFRETLTKVEVNPRAKQTLYDILEATLIEFLPDLYKKMDSMLLGHGAPEKVGDDSHWLKINPGTSQINNEYQQPAPINNASKPQQSSKTADLIPQQVQTVDTDSAMVSIQSVDTTEPATSEQHVAQNKITKPVINVARNLLNLVKEQDSLKHPIEPNTASTHNYSTEEICSALAHLQNSASTDKFQRSTSLELTQELSQTLDSLSSPQKNLSHTDQNNIEVFEQLFEILFNDMLLTQEIQPYLQRIHLPIMAQAIQDPSFLESSDHPIRNIVNHLSWLEPAVKNNKFVKNAPIRESLDHLVEKIAKVSPDNPDIFTSIEQQLDTITQSVKKSTKQNTKRVTDIYEGKQKLIKAQQSVQEEFNRRLSNRQIPKIIITLLDAGWQHLLVISKLNEDNNSFQSYLRTIINLRAWLTGPEKASKEQVETTIDFIDTQLQPICTNSFLHNKILHELNDLLQENSIQNTTDSMQMVHMDPLTISQKNPIHKDYFDKTGEIKTGEWLTFLLDQEITPLKLAWTGDILDNFVFVDRNGFKKLELEYEELAELIKNGTANRTESLDLPVMDRAINLMLQKMHKSLLNKATHDPVTQLLNRKEFIKQIKQKLSNFNDNQCLLLCNIEIQDYRVITNACGLSGGDALLKQLADSLKDQLAEDEIVARLDDRTFSILFKDNSNEKTATIAKNMQSKLIAKHFNWQDKSFSIAVAIGIVPLYPGLNYKINSVLQNADSATLSAINAGRNRIQVYEENDDSLKSQFNEFEWVGRINEVFAENRLFLRCQKISAIDPETNSHTHYEILLGINDEKGNVIPPDDFIPAVERCQRMSEIDRWVVLTVFAWIEENLFDFEMLDGFSINLSGESINSEEFLEFLKQTLASSNIPKEKITFEITETVAAGSFQFIQSFIKQIKAFNCKFSLDDFGSGYSSYAYLKNLDVDYLKIDGVFVKDILDNDADIAIVKSMTEIAHSLGLKTIAEYVENDEILAVLKEIGVDYAQGWGIHKPMKLTDLA